MAKPNITIFLVLSSLLLIVPLSYSDQKVTNVRIYLQGQFDTTQPIAYGDVLGFQEYLTVGSDPNSTFLGYAQGTIAFANNQGTLYDLHVSLTYIFMSGEFNGSTVVAVGKNDLTQEVREFAIVGGTGAFKLARGIVTGRTFSEEPPIYIYDLEVFQDSPMVQMYV